MMPADVFQAYIADAALGKDSLNQTTDRSTERGGSEERQRLGNDECHHSWFQN